MRHLAKSLVGLALYECIELQTDSRRPQSISDPSGSSYTPPHHYQMQIIPGLRARYKAAIPSQIIRPLEAPRAEPRYKIRPGKLHRVEAPTDFSGIRRRLCQRQRDCREVSGTGNWMGDVHIDL